MKKDEANKYMGCGWSFPPTFSRETKGVQMFSNEMNIAKSIKMIVLTRLGERVLHADFGTNISDFTFMRNINTSEKYRLKKMIEYAIVENEFRVNLDQIDIQNNIKEDCIEISISYTIKANNTKYNMVFPFYYENGTPL